MNRRSVSREVSEASAQSQYSGITEGVVREVECMQREERDALGGRGTGVAVRMGYVHREGTCDRGDANVAEHVLTQIDDFEGSWTHESLGDEKTYIRL